MPRNKTARPNVGPRLRPRWAIYCQDGEKVALLRVGSVRFGRAMRAAREINKYTQARVFITKSEPQAIEGRFYA